ncbi:MAG: rhomboid family intramembrane serine protease [Victivallales bacterium]|nr:rhomboid family intramembrane serine protease [Victivallales bacterium]
MLNDRDYMRMRQAPFRSGPTSRRGSGGYSIVTTLIFINIAMFILQFLFPDTRTEEGMISRFALVSTSVRAGEVYRIFTSMFLHGGIFHILFNMWGLYLFGSLLEQRIGNANFAVMYFISGTVGALLWLAVNWNSNIPCIGASGALFGVIIATAMFFPDVRIMLLFPPIPMKLKTFAIVYIIIEIYLELSKNTFGGNVAHVVHLGGALGGYVYIKLKFGRQVAWDILPNFLRGPKNPFYKVSSGWSITPGPGGSDVVTQKELDYLLDKISISGINSLTEDEMDTLRRAREQIQESSKKH